MDYIQVSLWTFFIHLDAIVQYIRALSHNQLRAGTSQQARIEVHDTQDAKPQGS